MKKFLIMIEVDEDHVPENSTDIPDLAAEMRSKTERGEWQAYGVGLAFENEHGRVQPDYSTFVWGCVTDFGFTGTYLSADKISNTYLRELAKEQISEYTERS